MGKESAQRYVGLWLSVLAKVSKDPATLEAIKGVSFTLVQSFTDLNGAAFSVSIDDGKISFQEGEIPNYQTKVSLASKDFEDMVTEKLPAMTALQQGLIEIDGELGALLNLAYLMPPMKQYWLELTQK